MNESIKRTVFFIGSYALCTPTGPERGTFQSAATSNGRRALGAYWNRRKSEGCCGLESPRSGGGANMRPQPSAYRDRRVRSDN